MIKPDKDWLILCLANLGMQVGKEYSPYALFVGVVIISNCSHEARKG